jgi:hypothetical protein
MKELGLFFALAIFIVVATKFAQVMLKRMEKLEVKEKEENDDIDIVYSIPTSLNEEYKEVLKKDNCSSSRRPYKDYNDKQNLTKFNHGTYRDEKGRFQSKKKWKKEQNLS